MKKILIGLIIIGFVGAGQGVAAEAPPPNTQVEIQASVEDMPPTLINDVAVPFEVLMYAQMTYQGYAITHAEKLSYLTKPAFRLRVDRDGSTDDSLYLLYTQDWVLIGEDKMVRYEPRPLPTDQQPLPRDIPQESAVTSTPEADEGRGGGYQEVEPEAPEPEGQPEQDPEQQPEPDPQL